MEQNLATYEFYRRSAQAHERDGRVDAAWARLEAVHILGQRETRLHVAAHAAMLALAWRTRVAERVGAPGSVRLQAGGWCDALSGGPDRIGCPSRSPHINVRTGCE